jgi:probable rRNA maturation factor
VSGARLAGVIDGLAASLGRRVLSGEVVVLLGGDRVVRRLNRTYRHKDAATDVLAFPRAGGRGSLGDIVISVETAARNARRDGWPLQRELEILTLHGALHLLGYDHERDDGRMQRLERRLRRRLGLCAPPTRRRGVVRP